MSNYIISCCSTADLNQSYFDDNKVPFACFQFFVDDVMYEDNLGKSMDFATFYQKMRDGAMTRTSQVNAEGYIEMLRPYLEEGKDVLHITLSSGISGTYNSACIAKNMLSEEFPDRTIYVIDSLTASVGYGLLVDTALAKQREGMDIHTLNQWILDNRLKLKLWLMVSDLTYLVRGGRVSKASGAIGNLLNICPLIDFDVEGKLSVREKVRTKKKALKTQVEKMKESASGGTEYNGKCFISHSDCLEDAKTLAAMVEEAFPNLNGPVEISNIGTVIGSHTGPGAVVLCYWGDEDTV
ncbi:MAG: DegV family protein [Lachnospiraceae bacterium]|nr:DegV family protein [Lachnospiraceae bacterium]